MAARGACPITSLGWNAPAVSSTDAAYPQASPRGSTQRRNRPAAAGSRWTSEWARTEESTSRRSRRTRQRRLRHCEVSPATAACGDTVGPIPDRVLAGPTIATDAIEALFIAADGTVLETAYGNVFLLLADGTLITPPLRDDLLPGVTRRALLDHARDESRPAHLRGFDRNELTANAAFWTNSLSGAVPIASVDGVPLPRRDDQIAAFARFLVGARA